MPLSPKRLYWKLPLPPRPWLMSQGEGWACAGLSFLLPGGHSTISPPLKSMPLALAPRTFPSFLSGHTTWLRDFFSMLPPAIILVFLSSDVNLLRFFPLSLKMSVPLPEEEVLNILAKANPVLTCLSGTLCHQLLYSHTWFQKPKKASHQSASPWPSGTCLRPNGQLSLASLCALNFLCGSSAVSHAPFGNQFLAPSFSASLTVPSLPLQPCHPPFM